MSVVSYTPNIQRLELLVLDSNTHILEHNINLHKSLCWCVHHKVSMSVDEYSFSLSSLNASYSSEWDGFPLSRQITAGSSIGIIIFFTIIGNLMVMAAFYRDQRIKSKIANWYIFNLSVADFFVGSFSLSFDLHYLLKDWWVFGTTFCKIYLLVDYVVVTVPVFTIICISLDRYWLVTKKSNYPKYATKTKAAIFIVSMWTFLITFYGLVNYAWLPVTGLEPLCITLGL